MASVSSSNRSSKIFLRSVVIFCALAALSALTVFWGPRVYDQYLASRYQATPRIAAITERIKLSDDGKTVFYASRPAVESATQFNKDCQSTERTTAMLGCYYRRQIYLFDVTNQELDGAVEVTAAHEMLHAAYDRMNVFERRQVDDLVKIEYDKVKNDPDIKSLMAYYRQAEPGSDINELHSIIGTTVAQVSPELEAHYRQYFNDRQSIVAMNARYTAVFKSVQARSDELANQLKGESEALNQAVSLYETDRSQLEIDIQSFNARANDGGFGSRSAFEAARGALLARVNELNARRDTINREVEAYNDKAKELQALSVRSNELNKSINGITTPATGL